MTQCLRAHAALSEDPGLQHQGQQHILPFTPAPWELAPSFGPHGHLYSCVHSHTQTHTYMELTIKIFKGTLNDRLKTLRRGPGD